MTEPGSLTCVSEPVALGFISIVTLMDVLTAAPGRLQYCGIK